MCGSTNRTPTRDLVTLQHHSSAEARSACAQPLPLWQKAAAGSALSGRVQYRVAVVIAPLPGMS